MVTRRDFYIQSAYLLPDETKRTQDIRPFGKIDDSFKKSSKISFSPTIFNKISGGIDT